MTKCPICHRQADPEFKPFCSQRCAEVDLGRWLTESYSVPERPHEEEEEE
jgi:endogenous inhibitor of DNA gyrase (YacG/DUF329 family)